jgi:Tol biopolymer transport system component
MTTEICTYDLATGEIATVLRSDRLLEAPNWAQDDTLLVNGDGRLYRLPLTRPRLQEVDTGGLHQLNNDHGLSPDGREIVFSDKTETGESCIYRVPVGGGRPVRVTRNVPSYWHGWAPDGATLAYVGRRDGSYDIYTAAPDGSGETRLTFGFDHCDGPDYTPDGEWLWFNGEKDGAVDLWRIPATGGTPERMTEDDHVNWFPHPSPDGRHVLYVAFPPGTRYHPRDREVSLRLMPAKGGAARALLTLYGGQGTINVPCWAPDGRRFAFARYARPDGSF